MAKDQRDIRWKKGEEAVVAVVTLGKTQIVFLKIKSKSRAAFR
jgi:hypothetical protein